MRNKGNMKEQSVQWKALSDEKRTEFGDPVLKK